MELMEKPYFNIGSEDPYVKSYYENTNAYQIVGYISGLNVYHDSANHIGIPIYGNITVYDYKTTATPYINLKSKIKSQFSQGDFGSSPKSDQSPCWGSSLCFTNSDNVIDLINFDRSVNILNKNSVCIGSFKSFPSFSFSQQTVNYIASPDYMHGKFSLPYALKTGLYTFLADSTLISQNASCITYRFELYNQKPIAFTTGAGGSALDKNIYLYNIPSFASYAESGGNCVYAYVKNKIKTADYFELELALSPNNKLAINNFSHYGDINPFAVGLVTDSAIGDTITCFALNQMQFQFLQSFPKDKDFYLKTKTFNSYATNGPNVGDIVALSAPWNNGVVKYNVNANIEDFCKTTIYQRSNEISSEAAKIYAIATVTIYIFSVECKKSNGTSDFFYIITKGLL